MNIADQINSHFGLFINYVAQVGDQELALFFTEAQVIGDKHKEMTFNEGTQNFVSLNVNPIESTNSSKKYKATFKRFIVYQVVDESCISWDDAEVFEGKLFRTFTKSRFLEHIAGSMNIDWYNDAPEMKYQHYQIGGLDFIVDVAAHEDPIIEEVEEFLVK